MHFPRHPLRGTTGQRQLTKRSNACRFHACCGVVRNVCCDVSAPSGAVFKLSIASLPAAVERDLTGASARRVRLDRYSCRALELM
jgi:hypothetical protein